MDEGIRQCRIGLGEKLEDRRVVTPLFGAMVNGTSTKSAGRGKRVYA